MLWGPSKSCGIQHRHTQISGVLEHLYFCCSSGSTALGTGAQGKPSEQSIHGIEKEEFYTPESAQQTSP